MKIGLLTAIFGDLTFEEVVKFSKENKIECLEVACWPKEKAARRYAGVSHIDVAHLNAKKAKQINALCKKNNLVISSLAYYPNYLDPDQKKAQQYIKHLYKVIDASKLLGINLVTTFIGRNKNLSVDENLKLVKKVWPPILKYANKRGVKIGIENCPMLFTNDEWPGGQNIMTTPNNWRKVFKILDSKNLGLNFDPSHFVWQGLDYIKVIKEFKNKLFHIHYKDIKVYKDKLSDAGYLALPLEFMSPKIPGAGDINWQKFMKALKDINYRGASVVEIEDKDYEKTLTNRKLAVQKSLNYIRKFR